MQRPKARMKVILLRLIIDTTVMSVKHMTSHASINPCRHSVRPLQSIGQLHAFLIVLCRLQAHKPEANPASHVLLTPNFVITTTTTWTNTSALACNDAESIFKCLRAYVECSLLLADAWQPSRRRCSNASSSKRLADPRRNTH